MKLVGGGSITTSEVISKGVRVVVRSRRFLRSASIVLLIGRGSIEDPVEGCACLMNRMLMRLNSRLSTLQLQTVLDRIGATIDATTDRDLMMLRAQVPSEKIVEGLKLIAELFSAPSFAAAEVAKEKLSQRLEYERVREDPVTAAMEDTWEAAFPGNPLGHPVTGYPHTIEKLTTHTLEEFHADTRHRAYLVIGIVGPAPESLMVEQARSVFEATQNAPRNETIRLGRRCEFRVHSRNMKVNQTTFSIGLVTPSVSSPDYPSLLLIEDYLGSNRHYYGVLTKELREKRGLTYFAHSRLSALRNHGLLTAFAGVKHEKVPKALSLMLKSMVELRDKSLPEKKLERLKVFHMQAIEMALEAPYQAATWLAANVFRGGKVDLEPYASDIDGVTAETVKSVMERCLTPSRVAISIAGRPPDDESLSAIMRKEVT